MKNVIITVGRQFGSGGHEIGEKLAKRLGVPFYDKELLAKAAKRCGLSEDMVKQLDEKPTSSFLYALSIGSTGYNGDVSLPLGNQVFLAMAQVIKDIAEEGSCVIVGRCAEYILAERDDVLSVFVHADKDARIRRIMEKCNLTEKEAAVLIQKTDKRRAGYHDFYCDDKWGAAASYDLTVNSAAFGIDAAVDMIAGYVENR